MSKSLQHFDSGLSRFARLEFLGMYFKYRTAKIQNKNDTHILFKRSKDALDAYKAIAKTQEDGFFLSLFSALISLENKNISEEKMKEISELFDHLSAR